jgi:hypothetical protein
MQIVCAALLAQGLLGSLASPAEEPRPAPPIAERLHSATAAVEEKAIELGAAAKLHAREVGASARRLSRTVADQTKARAHAIGAASTNAIAKAKAAVRKQRTAGKTDTPGDHPARPS